MHPNKRRSPTACAAITRCVVPDWCAMFRYPDTKIQSKHSARIPPRFTTRRDHGSPRIGSVPRIIKTLSLFRINTTTSDAHTENTTHRPVYIRPSTKISPVLRGTVRARALPCIRLHTRKRRPATCDGTWAACVRRAYVASHIPIPHPAPNAQAVITCRRVHARCSHDG